jgi:serine/threonine protein kinase
VVSEPGGPQAEGPNGAPVAVKALSLRHLRDWKQLELFEREARTLRTLSHPGIPAYVDYFEEDTATDRGFFLVQVGRSVHCLSSLFSSVSVDWSGVCPSERASV